MAHKIIIAGGTGFLGQSVIEYFEKRGNIEIIVLTRGAGTTKRTVTYVHWDAATLGEWVKLLEGSAAIINLTGKSVNCIYTKKNKKAIIDSRVNSTLVIGRAIQQATRPPSVWINAGSAAIFGNSGDEIKDENSPAGLGFSAEVCKQWEQAFFNTVTPVTRKVFLRMGLVFQKNRGLLIPFVNLVKAGLGGTIGSGNQYISWIHEQDFLNIVYAVFANNRFSGIVHCSSPFPITNRTFMARLRGSLNRPFGLPAPALLVKIGALFIGTEAELVLAGRRVVSVKLEEKKFVFQYPQIEDALGHLLGKAPVYLK